MELGFLIGQKNSKSLKSGFRKSLYLSSMIVFVAFFSTSFFFHPAFAAASPGCGFFDLGQQCDLSGWLHLLFGDIVIGSVVGGVLAFLFHRLARRTQSKLEMITESQEVMRLRRRDYSVQHIKNLFNTLLFTVGIIKKSNTTFNHALASETRKEERLYIRGNLLSELRAEEAQVGRAILLIRNTLISSNDVIEPDLVDQVDGICTFIGELSAREQKDGTMVFPKYKVCKEKIRLMMEKLQTYSVATHSLKEPKIENSQTISEESLETLKKNSKKTIVLGDVR